MSIIWLSVPYSEKDTVKSLGAKWSPESRRWYIPSNVPCRQFAQWICNKPSIRFLNGEDREFGGNNLFVDLIPRSCWFTNARKCIHPSDWDRVRSYVYSRVQYHCEACGIDTRHSPTRIECHERWDYIYSQRVQKLVRLIALCKECHEATHMGLANIRDRGTEAKGHLMTVTGMNNEEADIHIGQAFSLWRDRSRETWKLDLSLLKNNGIMVVEPSV